MYLSNRAVGEKYGQFPPVGPGGDRPGLNLPASSVPHDRVRTSPHPRCGHPDVPAALARSITPSSAGAEWVRERMSHLRVANSRSPASMTPRSTVSVACGAPPQQHAEMVKAMVESIEENEAQIQRIRKECLMAMDTLIERSEKEKTLRNFLDQCSTSTKTMWSRNQLLMQSNAKIRQQLKELMGQASSMAGSSIGREPIPESP
ncbi:unnamed protein product [Ostreobium quekettii]|uniref:Uncharacterized protein n=1 Tax=Ostreobium quekettii TaxID=121088 RepID=A0A8S1IZ40_9CHLO|nr:unnamed protein product [Ostreobium quekettii]